ncbi:MAG TPA: glycosyltransferase family 2 protein [Bryobacterales bacterium]|jgi:glycosyltransferase involved in cell wall biosynthesis|nr:glycosyltransferase family 2 protein [Bryobacterales bacterium]
MLLSIVVPVYNEAESLPRLLEALREVLPQTGCEHELIFVNDGSRDGSFEVLSQAARSDPRVKILGLSRNFGHQAAITAGIDFAAGDAVAVMDADLQDPPELLPDMVDLFRHGYDVVSAQRVARDCDSFFKRATASLFYRFMRKAIDSRLAPQVGDFRLFSRRAVAALRGFREQHRFMRGLVAWLGLKEAILPFHRQPRAAGETKYSLCKMLRFAWTAISSFSALPLRLCLTFGLLMTLGGFLYFAWVLYVTVVLKGTVPGWTSLVGLQVIFSGSTLVAIGLVGDYIARIYEEAKGRPLYVVSEAVNFSHAERHLERMVLLPAPEERHDANSAEGTSSQPAASRI